MTDGYFYSQIVTVTRHHLDRIAESLGTSGD